jgi:hypothetical protein
MAVCASPLAYLIEAELARSIRGCDPLFALSALTGLCTLVAPLACVFRCLPRLLGDLLGSTHTLVGDPLARVLRLLGPEVIADEDGNSGDAQIANHGRLPMD